MFARMPFFLGIGSLFAALPLPGSLCAWRTPALSGSGRVRCRGRGRCSGKYWTWPHLLSLSGTRLVLLIDRCGDQLFGKLSPLGLG